MPPTPRQVVAAGADGVRDAGAEPVDAGGDLLRAGARGADHADRAAPHDVGEAERNAVDDRRAAVGPHDQEVALAASRLSATSSASGTLSLNSMTFRPSSSAFIASAAA